MDTTVAGAISHGSDGKFRFDLEDEVSGAHILHVEMDAVQFSNFITSRYETNIRAELYVANAHLWGTHTSEQRTFRVPFDSAYWPQTRDAVVAAHPEWKFREASTERYNGNQIKGKMYEFLATRYVPIETSAGEGSVATD